MLVQPSFLVSRVSFGDVCVLSRSFGFSIGGFEFFRVVVWFVEKRWFLVKLRFSSKVRGVLEVLAQFLESSPIGRWFVRG